MFGKDTGNGGKVNPMQLMQLASRWKIFNEEHPKVMPFFKSLADGTIEEGAVIEIRVTDTSGQEHVSNIRVSAEDVKTMQMVKEMNNA